MRRIDATLIRAEAPFQAAFGGLPEKRRRPGLRMPRCVPAAAACSLLNRLARSPRREHECMRET